MPSGPRNQQKQSSPMERHLYKDREQVTQALTFLGNHNLLMRYAVAHQQSIPATRLHFEKVVLGHVEGQ